MLCNLILASGFYYSFLLPSDRIDFLGSYKAFGRSSVGHGGKFVRLMFLVVPWSWIGGSPQDAVVAPMETRCVSTATAPPLLPRFEFRIESQMSACFIFLVLVCFINPQSGRGFRNCARGKSVRQPWGQPIHITLLQ